MEAGKIGCQLCGLTKLGVQLTLQLVCLCLLSFVLSSYPLCHQSLIHGLTFPLSACQPRLRS